jgi:hypothetical protein
MSEAAGRQSGHAGWLSVGLSTAPQRSRKPSTAQGAQAKIAKVPAAIRRIAKVPEE